jgi:XapX domain-containing protein
MLMASIGLALGLGIGAGCRWFDIPSPAPPSLIGAFLLVSITLGSIAADSLLFGGQIMAHWSGQ